MAKYGIMVSHIAGKRPYFFYYVQNGPKNLGNFRGFLKIILGKFLDFAGFLGDFFKLRVGSPVTHFSVERNF